MNMGQKLGQFPLFKVFGGIRPGAAPDVFFSSSSYAAWIGHGCGWGGGCALESCCLFRCSSCGVVLHESGATAWRRGGFGIATRRILSPALSGEWRNSRRWPRQPWEVAGGV